MDRVDRQARLSLPCGQRRLGCELREPLGDSLAFAGKVTGHVASRCRRFCGDHNSEGIECSQETGRTAPCGVPLVIRI